MYPHSSVAYSLSGHNLGRASPERNRRFDTFVFEVLTLSPSKYTSLPHERAQGIDCRCRDLS